LATPPFLLHAAARVPDRVVGKSPPPRLAGPLAFLEDRPPQPAFLYAADLPKRAVATSVLQRGARLEPVDAHRFEREPHEELGAVDERAGSPERRPESKSPLRGPEPRFELAQLEDADRRVTSRHRHPDGALRPQLPHPHR